MNMQSLFQNYRGLDFEKPQILWYPSGGTDWFPLVGYSRGFRHDLSADIQALTMPKIFVYTCLGTDVPENVSGAFFESGILFEDQKTKITSVNPRRLKINRGVYRYEICSDYVKTFGHNLDPLQNLGFDAIHSKVQLLDKQSGYGELLELIYIFGENINFFNSVVLAGYVDVLHLCAIREGCGFGGCRKSVIDYFYGQKPLEESVPKPQSIVAFTDFTYNIIRDNLKYKFLVDSTRFHPKMGDPREIPDFAFYIGEGVVLNMEWENHITACAV